MTFFYEEKLISDAKEETIDVNAVNDILIEIRKKAYGML